MNTYVHISLHMYTHVHWLCSGFPTMYLKGCEMKTFLPRDWDWLLYLNIFHPPFKKRKRKMSTFEVYFQESWQFQSRRGTQQRGRRVGRGWTRERRRQSENKIIWLVQMMSSYIFFYLFSNRHPKILYTSMQSRIQVKGTSLAWAFSNWISVGCVSMEISVNISFSKFERMAHLVLPVFFSDSCIDGCLPRTVLPVTVCNYAPCNICVTSL